MTWWSRYKPAPRIDVSEVMELPSQSNKVVENGNVFKLLIQTIYVLFIILKKNFQKL